MSEQEKLYRRDHRNQTLILLLCLAALNLPLVLPGFLWGWHARPPAYFPYAMSGWPVIVGGLLIWYTKHHPLPLRNDVSN